MKYCSKNCQCDQKNAGCDRLWAFIAKISFTWTLKSKTIVTHHGFDWTTNCIGVFKAISFATTNIINSVHSFRLEGKVSARP